MIAIIYTDGLIKCDDLKNECQHQKWIPITVYKDKNHNITVICFEDVKIAKQFAKRNFPKEWIKGAISLADDDIEFIKNKNWKIEIMTYPRLLNSHHEYKLGFEIIDFADEPKMLYA